MASSFRKMRAIATKPPTTIARRWQRRACGHAVGTAYGGSGPPRPGLFAPPPLTLLPEAPEAGARGRRALGAGFARELWRGGALEVAVPGPFRNCFGLTTGHTS